MPNLTIHIPSDYQEPILYFQREDKHCAHSGQIRPSGRDHYGLIFQMEFAPSRFDFYVKESDGSKPSPTYHFLNFYGQEIWCRKEWPELYEIEPAAIMGDVNEVYESIRHLLPDGMHVPDTDVTGSVTHSMLGATPLKDGRILFGFFHPKAARVYLTGSFNHWAKPGDPDTDAEALIPMGLYRGYYGQPNIWLALITPPLPGQEWEYAYFIQGGCNPDQQLRTERLVPDPLTRVYSQDRRANFSKIVDASRYQWEDKDWHTPSMQDLIIYEANVYGITQGNPQIPRDEQGTFKGLSSLIRHGYFKSLGMTVLALMPTSEAPSLQGPQSMGYDPCGFASIERDFGTPDDLRELIDTAHQHDLAVIADLVFNHTSNTFNPLWGLISDGTEGGFYFSSSTPWGNRIATEREEIQNFLIDVSKLLIKEYHFDGFRFDATHSSWMSHDFLRRLAYEIKDKGFKRDCILIAENLPNEFDLNLDGYNGFAQWCDPFHDKIKALLREGVYQDWVTNNPKHLADVFYFSKAFYSAHTNNVINYCESHDENSVPFEVGTAGDGLVYDEAKTRKAKLGLFATAMALGQPMIYMGQEFGTDRPRNLVLFDWPNNPKENPFFAWTRRLFSLRRRYPGLRVFGYHPEQDGTFQWMLGPWMDDAHGKNRNVIGWRTSQQQPAEDFAVFFNFDPHPVQVDLDLGKPGVWLKLADIDQINDVPPEGLNTLDDPTALHTRDGSFNGFLLPGSSGFVYRWLQ